MDVFCGMKEGYKEVFQSSSITNNSLHAMEHIQLSIPYNYDNGITFPGLISNQIDEV